MILLKLFNLLIMHAVIFSSTRTDGDKGYSKMVELASQQAGLLGVESARDEQLGIIVS